MTTCARCGLKQPAENLTYSRHTKNSYCLDFAGCDARKKRDEKKAA